MSIPVHTHIFRYADMLVIPEQGLLNKGAAVGVIEGIVGF